MIMELESELIPFKQHRGLQDRDLERFLEEEREYLALLSQPRQGNELDVLYVEALEAWEDAKYGSNQLIPRWSEPLSCRKVADDACQIFMAQEHEIILKSHPKEARRLLANLSRRRTAALEKLDQRINHVMDLEAKLDIAEGERWNPEHPHRLATVMWMSQRDYHAALDDLERLVVQRLFELTKLNMSGTGKSFMYI
jgi:hypothetical protein